MYNLGFLIIILFFYLCGIFLTWNATKNLYSPLMFISYIYAFGMVGGLFYYIQGHWLTLFSISLGMLCIGIGSIIGKYIFDFNPSDELVKFRLAYVNFNLPFINLFYCSLVVLTFIALVSIIWMFLSAGIPLLGSDRMELLKKGVILGVHFGSVFFPGGGLILTLIWIFWVSFVPTKKNKFFLMIILIFFLFSYILSGFRSFPIFYMLCLVTALSFIKKIKSYIIILSLIIAILGAGLIVKFGIYYTTQNPYTALLLRATVIEVHGLDYIIYNFVPNHGFLYGKGILTDAISVVPTTILKILGVTKKPLSFPVYLKKCYLIDIGLYSKVKHIGAFTTLMVGDFYANFGILGIIIGCISIGLFAEMLYIYTLRRNKTFFVTSILIYYQIVLIRSMSAGALIAAIIGNTINLTVIYGLLLFIYFSFSMPFIDGYDYRCKQAWY